MFLISKSYAHSMLGMLCSSWEPVEFELPSLPSFSRHPVAGVALHCYWVDSVPAPHTDSIAWCSGKVLVVLLTFPVDRTRADGYYSAQVLVQAPVVSMTTLDGMMCTEG